MEILSIKRSQLLSFAIGTFVLLLNSCVHQSGPDPLEATMRNKEVRLRASDWQRHSQANSRGDLIDDYAWQKLDYDSGRKIASVWIKTKATGTLEYLEYDCAKQRGQITYTIHYKGGERVTDSHAYDLNKTDSARSFNVGNFELYCNTR